MLEQKLQIGIIESRCFFLVDKQLYYDPQKMLSYNRVLNFVIGARGIGKTYATKKHLINRFLKYGEQFIYVRRYKTELRKVKNFFLDVEPEFEKVNFKVKGRELYINDKVAGYAVPLSTWQSEKSNAYPKVSTIMYDEFIREKDNSSYLPNEVEAFLNFMDTVFRNRENIRTICLSNSVSVVNPYFLYFSLTPDIEKRFNATESILIEIPDSQEFSNERRKTKFGKLIDETNYSKMSLDNQFTGDSYVFVEKRSKESKFKFSVTYKGMTLGVWADEFTMYLSSDHDPTTKSNYVLSKDDMKENTMLIRSWKNTYHLKRLVSAFEIGCLRFDNQVIRTIGYEILKSLKI